MLGQFGGKSIRELCYVASSLPKIFQRKLPSADRIVDNLVPRFESTFSRKLHLNDTYVVQRSAIRIGKRIHSNVSYMPWQTCLCRLVPANVKLSSLIHTSSSCGSNRFEDPPGVYRNSGYHEEERREGRPKTKRIRNRIWHMIKVFLLGTGALVWTGLLIAYLSVEEVKIQEVQSEDDSDIKLRALIFYDIKKLSARKHFKKAVENQEELDKLFSNEDVKDEIFQKGAALTQLWDQLKKEDNVILQLGNPAQISGYRCARIYAEKLRNDFHDVYNPNYWRAQCFVEGPLSAGLLSLTFERENKDSEWVPTSVHLESVGRSGDVLCDISRPLPLGVKNFTRLSK